MIGSDSKLLASISDFEKALKFYNKVLQVFGQSYNKLQVTFPSKYQQKDKFISQFGELDDLEKLMWCDHQLKQAYLQYNKRDGETARKNILWTLMICKEFKITLNKEYQLMKMIRQLWYESKVTNQQNVKDSLRQIFFQLGEEPQPKNRVITNGNTNTQSRKGQNIGCCGASNCQIF